MRIDREEFAASRFAEIDRGLSRVSYVSLFHSDMARQQNALQFDVHGPAQDLVERAIPYVTVYSGIAGINALEATPEVIAALPGMTQDTLNAILRQRQMAPQDVRAVSTSLPAQAGASTETSKAARIAVRIDFENGRRIASEAVISVSDDPETPYRILSWHDGFDDPAANQQPMTMRQ